MEDVDIGFAEKRARLPNARNEGGIGGGDKVELTVLVWVLGVAGVSGVSGDGEQPVARGKWIVHPPFATKPKERREEISD